MKVIVFAVLLTVARAGFVAHHAPVVAHVAEVGHSNQHRSQDLVGNYNFGYNEQHTSGGSFRQESGDAWGNKVGSYGLNDADGRVRVVKYVADGAGFRAAIATNEPGTAASLPAAASYNAAHAKVAVVAAPVVAHAAVPVASYAAAPYARYGVAHVARPVYGGYGLHGGYGGLGYHGGLLHYGGPGYHGGLGYYGGYGAYGAHKYLG